MSPSQRERSDATTRRLLEVATELFTERGYAGVGLTEIAARAQVTRGALYHHFGSKDGLFTAVLEQIQQEVAERVVTAAGRAQDPWGELVAGCHAFLDAGTDPRIQRIMLLDAPAVLGWQQWREIDAAGSARLLQEVLTDLESDGVLLSGVAAPAAHLLSGAMNEAALWIARSADPERDAAAARTTLDRLLTSLRASSA